MGYTVKKVRTFFFFHKLYHPYTVLLDIYALLYTVIHAQHCLTVHIMYYCQTIFMNCIIARQFIICMLLQIIFAGLLQNMNHAQFMCTLRIRRMNEISAYLIRLYTVSKILESSFVLIDRTKGYKKTFHTAGWRLHLFQCSYF